MNILWKDNGLVLNYYLKFNMYTIRGLGLFSHGSHVNTSTSVVPNRNCGSSKTSYTNSRRLANGERGTEIHGQPSFSLAKITKKMGVYHGIPHFQTDPDFVTLSWWMVFFFSWWMGAEWGYQAIFCLRFRPRFHFGLVWKGSGAPHCCVDMDISWYAARLSSGYKMI